MIKTLSYIHAYILVQTILSRLAMVHLSMRSPISIQLLARVNRTRPGLYFAALALILSCGHANSGESHHLDLFSPFSVSDRNPLIQVFGLAEPTTNQFTPTGRWQWALSTEIVNTSSQNLSNTKFLHPLVYREHCQTKKTKTRDQHSNYGEYKHRIEGTIFGLNQPIIGSIHWKAFDPLVR